MRKLLAIEKIEKDQYVKIFKETASKEQLKFLSPAYKILQNCSMGLIFDFTDDYHLDCLTTALIEVSRLDCNFIDALEKVETEEQYVALKDRIPDNNVLKYYMEDGIENLLECAKDLEGEEDYGQKTNTELTRETEVMIWNLFTQYENLYYNNFEQENNMSIEDAIKEGILPEIFHEITEDLVNKGFSNDEIKEIQTLSPCEINAQTIYKLGAYMFSQHKQLSTFEEWKAVMSECLMMEVPEKDARILWDAYQMESLKSKGEQHEQTL